jgi:adenine-specific DNA methylase
MNQSKGQISQSEEDDQTASPEGGIVRSLNDARHCLSKHLRMPVRDSDILGLLQLNIIVNLTDNDPDIVLLYDEIVSYGALVTLEVSNPTTTNMLGFDEPLFRDAPSHKPSTQTLVLQLEKDLTLRIDAASFRPYEYQLFRRELSQFTQSEKEAHYTGDIAPGATECKGALFISASKSRRNAATSIWARIADRQYEATDHEKRITPSLYGVKTRLLQLIASVVSRTTRPGGIVCDLMSGSGSVSRSLSKNHRVFSNDANSYGRVLAVSLTSNLQADDVDAITARLKARMSENMAAIERIFGKHLADENDLLHSARTDSVLERYHHFCETTPTFSGHLVDLNNRAAGDTGALRDLIGIRRGRPETFPFILATSYWANVHFGLRQCAVIDSVRYAIEQEAQPTKTILLGLLLQAALLCASGPHFAQPLKPKGPRQFKALIEKRAKRVDAEFFSLLSRRPFAAAPLNQLVGATKSDWREALQHFTSTLNGDRGTVYADPPYTSVQYSRYYHVLNVLVDYDYPVCSGPGICPVREYRFSSRFEFKAGPAKVELLELIQQCARSDVDLVLSYSKSGSVTVPDLIAELRSCYESVEVFQAPIKHHPQGNRAASANRLNTVEFVLAGSKPITTT